MIDIGEIFFILSILVFFLLILFLKQKKSERLNKFTLIINASNKDPKIPLKQYLSDTQEFLEHLRYQKDHEGGRLIYHPMQSALKDGNSVLIESSAWEIRITAPHFMIAILESHLGIKRIFFTHTDH